MWLILLCKKQFSSFAGSSMRANIDLSSRFLEFLPESNRRPRDSLKHCPALWPTKLVSRRLAYITFTGTYSAFQFRKTKYFEEKKQLIWYMCTCVLCTHLRTRTCRDFVQLHSSGPPGVACWPLGSHPSTTCLVCVSVCVCVYTVTRTHIHPRTLPPASKPTNPQRTIHTHAPQIHNAPYTCTHTPTYVWVDFGHFARRSTLCKGGQTYTILKSCHSGAQTLETWRDSQSQIQTETQSQKTKHVFLGIQSVESVDSILKKCFVYNKRAFLMAYQSLNRKFCHTSCTWMSLK